MPKAKILSDNLFPVVGIGASAGGLETFKRFLKAIPEDSGMAFILVQHLDPAHESVLANLLQRVTKIPVQEITDNIHVEANHIYIIPSNKLLTATDGVLKLSERPSKGQLNMPIDLFFSSLAEVHQSHAIGVVLSGTGSDGTMGLKAIKDHGGITFAQEPSSAAYEGMPESAITAEVVDFILPPEKIPSQLLELHDTITISQDVELKATDEEAFKQIINLIRISRGVDFTYYKPTTIRRRIARRMALSQQKNLQEYLGYLKANKPEQDILYQDLLIPVTQFFRDPEVFETMCETVFPVILKEKPGGESLRIWVAGCSTGEEVYSFVMCLHEFLGDKLSHIKIQVFATDVSDIAITKARNGTYKKSEVNGLSENRLQQFFTKTDGKYRINRNIRDTCIFANHNYLKDPPFANMDLISCRNSLIYLQPFLQKKALSVFHYALKEKGFLLLGKSETTGQVPELYNLFDKRSKIYTRTTARGKFLHVLPEHKEEGFKGNNYGITKTETLREDFQKNADDVLLVKYAPPGVVINEEMDIVQFRGATGIWLEPSSGKPNLNVLKMAREGLGFEIRNILHKAKSTKESLVKENIPMKFMGKERLVTIEVIPLLNTIELHFLILFRDSIPSRNSELEQGEEKNGKEKDTKPNRELLRITELEKELAQARDDMRSITEDQEAANEELQSANEELLSGSEELQSLNEELETSKEEIQTSNEELIIVNQELYGRNDQLNLSRLYAESIVSTIREPLIILNKNLQVRSANKSFYTKFQTTEDQTEGKLVFDLGNGQWNIPALRKLLEKILPENTSIVDFEVEYVFPGLGQRVMLVNASRIIRDTNDEQSILIAVEDITEQRQVDKDLVVIAEELEKQIMERTSSLHEVNTNLKHSNENLEQFAYIASHDLQEPLRKIRIFSGLLNDRYSGELPEAAKELLTKITRSAERMSTLIKEVLEFSKILQSNAVFKKINLETIIDEILTDFDLQISEKQAIIHRETLPVIEAIPVQVKQLFYNLISNSLKFSKKTVAPFVTISSRLLSPAELKKYKALNQKLNYCEISIQDNGVGFEQEFADQVFLIFHRLHNREEFTGTGIGLALCKKIVIDHQGEIKAVSSENNGALFQVLLPVTQLPPPPPRG